MDIACNDPHIFFKDSGRGNHRPTRPWSIFYRIGRQKLQVASSQLKTVKESMQKNHEKKLFEGRSKIIV